MTLARLPDFDNAIKLSPDSTAYTYRGALRQKQGDDAGALADFNNAIGLDPDSYLV